MVNPFLVSDKNSRSSKIKNAVLRRIKTYSLSKSNLIIVIGGDGFMLETLKKYNKYKKPFYGINSGNYGFLMNKFSEKTNYKSFNHYWCPRPDSNWHSQKGKDFKSFVSTNFTTRALFELCLLTFFIIKNQIFYFSLLH